MPELIAFRPRMGVERLKVLAKKMDYPNVSRFIEDAILEKVHREVHSKNHPEVQKLGDEIGKLVMKHLGIRWAEPNSKISKKIREEAKAIGAGKMKSYRWKGSLDQLFDDAKPQRAAPSSRKGH